MLLVLSITFYCQYIYGVVCVQLYHFSLGEWKDVSVAHVIIIIKLEVLILPFVIIFCCGSVPEMFITSYSVTYCIYILGKTGFAFCIIVQFMMNTNSRMRFGLQIVFVCLYITPLSSLYKLIWRHRTYKMPVRYILSSVWVRLSIFSQLSLIQYMELCVFSLPISLVMIDFYFVLLSSSNRKYELSSIV